MNTQQSASAKLQRLDGSPVRVLVVDDENNLTELLSMALRYEGWEVRTAATGVAAVRAAREFQPDAVVLDMMLPDFDGLEVLRRMRGDNPNVPVLFLTAKDAVEDRVAGLTAGGDDYVTKPFSLEEVVARLRALMRRTAVVTDDSASVLVVGDLTMDEDSHEVTRGGDQINLTATEFELLRYLMRNPKRVLSKAQILDRVWNYDFGGQANVVELYISYLRKKIDAGREPMIHTMRGVGYVLKPAGMSPAAAVGAARSRLNPATWRSAPSSSPRSSGSSSPSPWPPSSLTVVLLHDYLHGPARPTTCRSTLSVRRPRSATGPRRRRPRARRRPLPGGGGGSLTWCSATAPSSVNRVASGDDLRRAHRRPRSPSSTTPASARPPRPSTSTASATTGWSRSATADGRHGDQRPARRPG